MKAFMDADFLLQSGTAKKLFDAVKELPIIDYHCHLEPREIAENKRFANITEIWLGGDHYKWRLMRANGVDERFITGDAPDYEKFEKWCETIEDCIGSPLYHWTHLELQRYFNYNKTLSRKTAKDAWEHCNAVLASDDFTVWGIFEKFNVESLCTTDDPADSLEYHKQIAKSGIKTKVLPTLRPGKALAIADAGFAAYAAQLGALTGTTVDSYPSLWAALESRIDFFHENGCRLSDHALDPPVFAPCTDAEADAIVKKALRGEAICACEDAKFKTALMLSLGRKYAALGWTMQLHMCAFRNNNSRMFKALGADKGYDSIGDALVVEPISRYLDALATDDALPKTILYSLNPAADDLLATMIGNFQGGGVKGKMQHGSAWWFNDTKTGMIKQMTTLANLGMLARFIGMLTDSRSFLSYTRHEYFRRIAVNLLAEWVENGEFPNDEEKLIEIACGISYENAKEYFGF